MAKINIGVKLFESQWLIIECEVLLLQFRKLKCQSLIFSGLNLFKTNAAIIQNVLICLRPCFCMKLLESQWIYIIPLMIITDFIITIFALIVTIYDFGWCL